MFIFIDESGIHKKIDHTTFVLVYIKAIEHGLINKQIVEIEKRFKINNFHWSETAWKIKSKFIEEVLKLDFKVKIAVIKNPLNPKTELEKIFSHMIIERSIKHIYIDGKKPKWYERIFKKILKGKDIPVKKIKTVKDNQYPCIRLADMVAGLSRSYFDKKNIKRISKYYNRLTEKILIIIK